MKKKLLTYWVLLVVSILLIQAQQTMSLKLDTEQNSNKLKTNIAIATVENSINSKISIKAGRAPYYLIFDKKGVFIKSVRNPAINSRQGASSEVIDLLLKESCEIVIAGQFGNKMQNLLKRNNIKFYKKDGIADKVIQSYVKKRRSK